MGSTVEAKAEATSTPTLSLFSIPPISGMASPGPSGTLTPPLHATAAVPFRWEEKPGKPSPSLSAAASRRCLSLPPRLLLPGPKMTSPNTVLDGPYVGRSAQPLTRIFPRSGRRRARTPTTVVLGRRERGLFGIGCWGGSCKRGPFICCYSSNTNNIGTGTTSINTRGNHRDVFVKDNEGGCVSSIPAPPAYCQVNGGDHPKVKETRITKKGGFFNLSRGKSQSWARLYEGLKEAILWGRKRSAH